jgi:hypothetical protein
VYGNQPSHQIGGNGGGFAKALTRKALIADGQQFQASASMETFFGYLGYWPNVSNRFLGVRFLINGEVHYGWIAFRSVTDAGTGIFGAKLAGWAYETNPNTPIVAGNKGIPARITGFVNPTSLEILAAGHTAIDERRKRIAPVVGPHEGKLLAKNPDSTQYPGAGAD